MLKQERGRFAAKPPRLLFLDHCAMIGGAQISRRALYFRLHEEGCSVAEIVPSAGRPFPLQVRRRSTGLLALALNACYCFFLFLSRGRPYWYCNSILDRLQCIFVPPRYLVTHIRDLPRPWQVRVMRWLPCRCYLVSSSFMLAKVAQLAPFARPIHVVPNVVERTSGHREKALQARPFRILTVANLVPWKNHALAIEAVRWLASRGVQVRLDIWGGDPMEENFAYRRKLLEACRTLPERCVQIQEGKRIGPEDYRRYHCLLHPAEEEPFGRVVVEALLNGLPVLGPLSGNTARLLEDYPGGILYGDNRPETIGDAVWMLATHYSDYREAVRVARPRLENDFSAAEAVRALRGSRALPVDVLQGNLQCGRTDG